MSFVRPIPGFPQPFDHSFPQTRGKVSRSVSSLSAHPSSNGNGLAIRTDVPSNGVPISTSAPSAGNWDRDREINLSVSPSHSHQGVFTASPIQSSPTQFPPRTPPQPAQSQSNQSNPVLVKRRRGILVPVQKYLKPGTREAKRYAQEFGRFEFEGEVRIAGYGLWVVDKWVTDPTRLLHSIITPSTTNPTSTSTSNNNSHPSSSKPNSHASSSNHTHPTSSHAQSQVQPQSDQITLHLLTPSPLLTEVQAAREVENAVRWLRRGRDEAGQLQGGQGGQATASGIGAGAMGAMGTGGRGVQTDHGVMVVGNLNGLRQDVQPIPIPSGDPRPLFPLLHLKLNLRRLGCSSRSSLVLEPPSSATIYKFHTLYKFPSTLSGQGWGRVAAVVEELVGCLRVGLGLWGLGPGVGGGLGGEVQGEGEEGLCDDAMLRGLGEWRRRMRLGNVDGTGPIWGGIEDDPNEEILATQGPAIVAGLLSSITSVRVKLAALDSERVPRDPFHKIRDFQRSLRSFQRVYLHRTGTINDYLDIELYQAITDAYNKERHHDQTKLGRMLKNQVTQAGAGIASNIVSNLNIGLRRGERDRDSDDETYDTANDEFDTHGQGSGTGQGNTDVMIVNLDTFVRLVVGGKSGVGHGRLRALWTDRVVDHSKDDTRAGQRENQPGTSIQHDYAFDKKDQPYRAETAGEGDLDTVEEALSPDRRRHHRHRSLATRKGTLRNMTSKTGHALKDWARRGVFNDSGDEITNSAPASTTNFQRAPQQKGSMPVVILPDRDENGTPQSATQRNHYPSAVHRSPYSDAASRAASSRPSFRTDRSFAESDTYDGAVTDITAGDVDDYLLTRSARTSLTVGDQDPRTRLLRGSRRPLERMVSTGSVREALSAGAEWIHYGHEDWVYRREQAKQVRERGIVRRWSFETLTVPEQLEFVHPQYLQIDTDLCMMLLNLKQQEQWLRDKVEAYEVLEDRVQQTAIFYTKQFKARRDQTEALERIAQGLLVEPTSTGSSQFTPRADSDSLRDHSRLVANKRLAKQLALKNDKLSYSSRELERTVGGVETAKRVLDSFAQQYIDSVADEAGNYEGDAMQGSGKQTGKRGWTGWLGSFLPF